MSILCNGFTELRGFSEREVNESGELLRALGVSFENPTRGVLRVRGMGLFGLTEPQKVVDVGAHLVGPLLGILSAQEFASKVRFRADVSRTSVLACVRALVARGARLELANREGGAGSIDGRPVRTHLLGERYTVVRFAELP